MKYVNYLVLLLIILELSCKNKKDHCVGIEGKSILSVDLSKRIQISELDHFTVKELKLLRNEIYAHYGYIFRSKELDAYFRQYNWYIPKHKDQQVIWLEFCDVDRYNVALIKSKEEEIQ